MEEEEYAEIEAAREFFESEVIPTIAERFSNSDLPKSFQLTKSKGTFSIQSKGIMIIEVKVTFLEEGDAIQIDL